MPRDSVDDVLEDLDFVRDVYARVQRNLAPFEVVNSDLLPYGLKPNTRSVSWIAEQIINQYAKYNAEDLGLTNVTIDVHDTALHNCVLNVGTKGYYVNIKIRDLDKAPNSSDIAAVHKLHEFYTGSPDYRLVYVCFGIRFEGNLVKFDHQYLKVFSPQFLPLNVNRSINKIQARYDHEPTYRTRRKFLSLLAESTRNYRKHS